MVVSQQELLTTLGAALTVRPCTLPAPALHAENALMWTLFVDFWAYCPPALPSDASDIIGNTA